MTMSEMWEAIEPGSPILMLAVIVGLNRVFHVHSDTGAVLAGLGLGTVMVLGIIWFSRRHPAPTVRPLIRRKLLPWGVAFGLVGGAVMFLEEPWTYWGVAVLANGVLYMVFGALAYLRQSRAAG